VATAKGPGMAFMVFVGHPVFPMSEGMVVMVVVFMKSVEKHFAHAHDIFRYIVRVT
jgi:hypothetical protein